MLGSGLRDDAAATPARSSLAAPDHSDVKLSCRNLWKVYGEDASTAALLKGERGEVRRRLVAAGRLAAVADVSFDVRAGEIFIVMGLSGSGKSTLIRCLSRLVEPTAGSVLLDGKDLLKADARALIDLRRHSMGMVFQNFGLMPHMDVLDNVSFPLKLQGLGLDARHDKARQMIGLVGLQGREHSFPHQLSGGQQQRVGIARSLAVGPELWFLDEPFSALDPLIRRQMQDEFLRLQTMLNKTIVFITHDVLEAFRLADRVAIMRDGEFIQVGTPAELMLDPADDYVERFLEDVTFTRVLTAGHLMQRDDDALGEQGSGMPRIAASTKLEELLPDLAAGTGDFIVTDGQDRAIGWLTRRAVHDVLLRDRERRRR